MAPRPGLDMNMILSATADLADANGLDELTLAALSEKLGVKAPSLYNHVAGLPDLKRKLAVYGIREIGARLGAAAIGKSKDDAIRSFIYAYRSFAEERPGLYEAILRAPAPPDPEMEGAVHGLMDILFKVVEPYGFRKDKVSHAIRVVYSMVHGFVSLKAEGGPFSDKSLSADDTFELMIDIFLAGFHTLFDSVKEKP